MVAVLFTDLVGSTDLMARLGEAVFDELRRAHFAALAQAIEQTGGEEIKNTGDGVMATFGSVVDAIGCAVAMQQATDRQARTGEASLAIRVGLSVGEVTFEGDDVFGAPVVEAARLVAAAGSGQIVTTVIAKALAAGRAEADFVDLGPLDLKGLPQPVAACEVLWEPFPEPIVPMPGLVTDVGRIFVGRGTELERLRQLWKEAVAGERRVALIAGEPGVGKTRLAAELAAEIQGERATVLAGRCDEDLGVPYQPFVEALRHFVDHTVELDERLGRYGGELTRLVPELSDRVAGLPSPLSSDPETERYRLFDSVAAWLATVSADQPLLLVLDDLQWAAKPTLLLLRHVVRSPEPMRLCVVGTYRDTELSHDHPLVEVLADLRRQSGVKRLSLVGLDQLEVAAYVEQASGGALDDDTQLLAGVIHEETEGNPFFVREVLRHLAETGVVERQGKGWATRLPVEELGIPEGVREVVGKRLARLSGEANRVLRTAAVVGPEFEPMIVRAAGDFDEDELILALEEATGARLTMEAPTGRYRFAHALVRDTLYQGLSAVRRVALHRRVAEAIETVHAGRLGDHVAALAHHYARASAPAAESAKAVGYARQAGDRALAQLAHDEAVSYYQQALELLDHAEVPDGARLRLELLIALGEAERRAGDAAHRETLLQAADLAWQRSDVDAMAAAALANNRGALWSVAGDVDFERVAVLERALEAVGDGDSPTRARLLANLALELIWAGERERRFRLSDEALGMARRLGDAATLAHVLVNRAFAIGTPDTLEERLANGSELLSLAEQLRDPVMSSRAWSVRFRAAMEASDVEEADRCLQATEQSSAELGQPALRWLARMHRAGRALLAGHLAEAERLILEALELGRIAGQPDAPLLFVFQQFQVRFEQGRVDEALSELLDVAASFPRLRLTWATLALGWSELDEEEKAREAFEELAGSNFTGLPLDTTWLRGMTDCAAACAWLGDHQRAALLYDLLSPYASQVPVVGLGIVAGSVSHYLGILATTLGRFDGAEAHFATGASTHARIGASTWFARTHLEWARMLLTRREPGDAERARDLLSEAVATAREFGLGNVERRAVALLQ